MCAPRKWSVLNPIGVALIFCAFAFLNIQGLDDRPPFWDPATHGFGGAQLADALGTGDLLSFAERAYNMSYWPPGLSFLQIPGYLIFGPQFWVGRLTVFLCAVLAFLVLFRIAQSVADSRSGAVVLTTLAISGPIIHELSLEIMTEMVGMAVLLLGIQRYLAHLRSGQSLGPALGWFTALFFVKYNYGIQGLVVVVGFECYRHSGELSRFIREQVLGFLRGELRSYRAPWHLGFLLLIASLKLTGGWQFELGGQSVKLHTIGNPAYFYSLGLVLSALFGRNFRGQLIRIWDHAPKFIKDICTWVFVPVGLWFLNPNNLRTFFLVLQNQTDTGYDFFSIETIFLYPEVLVTRYAADLFQGLLVMALAAYGLYLGLRRSPRISHFFIATGFLINYGLVSFHHHKVDRYFSGVMPWVWLLCAIGIGSIVKRWQRLGWCIPVMAGFFIYQLGELKLEEVLREQTLNPEVSETADMVCKWYEPGTLVLGMWNELSPSLIKWRCLQQGTTQVFIQPKRFGLGEGNVNPRVLLEPKGIHQIIVADFSSDDQVRLNQYQFDIRWQPRDELLASGQFSLVESWNHAGGSYKLRLYGRDH